MAKVLFVTGKGGTGKSSLARKLAEQLAEEKKSVLLIKIDSFSLSGSGDERAYAVTPFLSEQKLQLHKVVEEYFTTTLAKIPVPGLFHKVATKIQSTLATKVLSNKYVLRFVEACPGLTPTIFLGKVCREAIEGSWDTVVVDAPSTGQALQLFESSRTLSRVLVQGVISRHILDTLRYVYSPNFEIQLVTLPEEGPLQECLEMLGKFKKLELGVARIWVNKVSPSTELKRLQAYTAPDSASQQAVQVEVERIQDQVKAIEDFHSKILEVPLSQLTEQAADVGMLLEKSA